MASSSDDVTKRKHAESEDRCGFVEDNKMGSANEHRRRSYSREDTPPAPCSVLCGPRSCSTLPSSLHHSNDGGTSPPEPKRRRLWGLRGLVKMFRRRVRRKGADDPSGSPQGPPPTLRARSASEIAVDPCNRSSSGPYNQGLSVSHDSVFSPESPTEQSHKAPPSLALATRGVNMSELKAALRRRRGEDSGSGDDDPGLPRSPPTSPTTLDVLNHGLKSYSRTTQSTCSDGSLLSMGSSENDEDSFGALSHHSSRASLIESRHQVVDHEPAAGIVHLSHKAAMHKIAVRPKRSHGIPHAKRRPQAISASLPATPEVNEDNSARNNHSDLTGSRNASTPVQVLTRHSTSSIATKALYSAKNEFMTEEVYETARKASSVASFNTHREERKEEAYHSSRHSSSGYSNQLQGVEDGRQPRRSALNSSYEEKMLINDDTEDLLENIENDEKRKWSGEKRKDPFKTSSGSKSSRQKSDPSRLSNREDEIRESEKEDKNGAYRSASVEGRLEGHLFEEISMSRKSYIASVPTHQAIKDVLARGRQSRQEEFHKERMENFSNEEASTIKSSSDYPEFTMKERTDSVEKRFSSSCNYLENSDVNKEDITKKQKTHSINSLDSCESNTSTLGGRSSTDSLTTTPLTGIYIRSSKSIPSRTTFESPTLQNKPAYDHSPKWKVDDFEVISGPLSLDSSLTIVQISQQDEEKIRKAFSVDEMGGNGHIISEPSRRSLDSTTSVDQAFSSKSASVFRSVSVHSPGPTLSNIRSRKSSLGDELEIDSSMQSKPLRPVKRESSLKKSKVEEQPGAVPEFMRIQLNRVDSKANSVIFDTDSESTSKLVTKTPPTLLPTKISKPQLLDAEKPTKISSLRKEDFEHSRECSEIVVDERIAVKTSKLRPENLTSNNSLEKDITPVSQTSKKSMSDNTVCNVINDSKGLLSSVLPGNVSNEPSKEEIILRRPSVMDRSAVLDQAVIGSQTSSPSAPINKHDQPELFKVFARRSFKLKDVELEATQSNSNIELDTKKETAEEKNCLSMDEPKTDESNGLITKDTTGNELSKNLPTLRSISSKRYSIGSTVPPNSVIPEQKQTVIVLAGNSKKDQMDSEPPVSFVKQDFRIRNIENPIPFSRSQSLTPSPKVEFHVKKPNCNVYSECATSSGSDGDDQVVQLRKGSEYISKQLSTPTRAQQHSNSPVDDSINNNTRMEGSIVGPSFSSAIIRRSVTPNFNRQSISPSNSLPESSSLETPTPNIVNNSASKPVVTRIQSVVWPPRSQPNESKTDSTESLNGTAVGASLGPLALSASPPSRSSLPPSKILSYFSESVSESAQSVKSPSSTVGDVPTPKKVETSNNISVSRRRLISGGSVKQNQCEPSPLIAEARNTSVAHTFDTQSSIGLSISSSKVSPVSASTEEKSYEESPQPYQSHRNSIGGNEDWRVLVRQRREDRMKQTKTQDSEEIIMETRPNVSRNSKVLEMASNFQKLQVA